MNFIYNKYNRQIENSTLKDVATEQTITTLEPKKIPFEKDIAYMKELFMPTIKQLVPYVNKVLNAHMYDGSPMFDDYINKEFIQQIVDEVLLYKSETDSIVNDIMLSENAGDFDPKMVLRSLVELIALNEIYTVIRPALKKYNENNIKDSTPIPDMSTQSELYVQDFL